MRLTVNPLEKEVVQIARACVPGARTVDRWRNVRPHPVRRSCHTLGPANEGLRSCLGTGGRVAGESLAAQRGARPRVRRQVLLRAATMSRLVRGVPARSFFHVNYSRVWRCVDGLGLSTLTSRRLCNLPLPPPYICTRPTIPPCAKPMGDTDAPGRLFVPRDTDEWRQAFADGRDVDRHTCGPSSRRS